MKKNKYIALLYKKLKGDISLEEQSMLDIWVSESPDNEVLIKDLEKGWELTEEYETTADLDIDVMGDFSRLQARIQSEEKLAAMPKDNLRVAHQPIGKVVQISTKKSSHKWIGWASAAVIALAVGFWFVNKQATVSGVDLIAAKTQHQEKKEVQLADGTKVWLNGNSQLTYPAAFTGEQRLVELTGEAFFDVTKNAAQPFIIETNKTKVTVLGTSFNVRAIIAENETEVVVKTGKVRLENKQGDQQIDLTPNQKGIFYAANNTIKSETEKDMNELAWHTNNLLFNNTPLQEVLADLSKQFDVSIQLNNASLNPCEYDGLHKTKDGINSILEQIAQAFSMELKETGNTSFELIGGICR